MTPPSAPSPAMPAAPAEEWERRSWRHVQGSEGAKTAQKWVAAWPNPTYDAPTLALRVCTYLGMELTVLSTVVGAVIRRDEPGARRG